MPRLPAVCDLVTQAPDAATGADWGDVSTDFAMQRARPDHLLSKLAAGGLSAGVVLLWWPHVFAHDSAASWVWRGIGWTLLAELLVMALSPLEHVLRAGLARVTPFGRARGRVSLSPRQRAQFALVLGALALCLPLTLIATGRPAPAQPPEQRVTNVTRVVKVVKRVQVRRIVIRRPAPAVAAPVPAATVTPAPVAAAVRPTAGTTAAAGARASEPRATEEERGARRRDAARSAPTPTPTATPVASPAPIAGA